MSMTIKQAFEKLTMVCGAALKNPFFVQRNLHDAFADIATNIDSGSSSAEDVSYDNTDSGLTADNVQAAIDEVLGKATKINYSTTEQDTGLTWIDGKKIYTKVYDIEHLPNATSTDYNPGITNFGAWVPGLCNVAMIFSSGNSSILPYMALSGSSIEDLTSALFQADGTIKITAKANRSTASGKCILYYTKSST